MKPAAPVIVRLAGEAHGHSPSSWGIEIDEEGRAVAWQTSGNRVGRFSRALSARERDKLERALTRARAAPLPAPPPSDGPIPPSGSSEQLIAAGLPGVELDPHEKPPRGFGDLVRLLASLREDLADSPVAAIELDVHGSPLAARLRYIGSEPLAVRLGTLTVQTTVFGKDSAIVDSSTRKIDASGTASPIGPGWVLPLADDLGRSKPPRGGMLTVNVGVLEVDALGDGVLRPVELGWMVE